MGSNENVNAWLDAAPNQVRETTQELLSQVEAMRDAQTIYPPQDDILNALAFTAPADVRVVILGQDPYHGPGQAMGLSFSVPAGCKLPPSLRNMYKEMAADLGGRAGRAAAQHHAHGARARGGVARQAWLAGAHRPCGALLLGGAATGGVPDLGQARHRVGGRGMESRGGGPCGGIACQQACAQEHAPFAAFGKPRYGYTARVHGVASVFPGQQHIEGRGRTAHRLAERACGVGRRLLRLRDLAMSSGGIACKSKSRPEPLFRARLVG